MSRLVIIFGVVAAGGVVGTALRLAASELAGSGGWSTAGALLGVNVVGSFLLGWLVAARPRQLGQHSMVFWTAGVLASFTTFSGLMVFVVEEMRAGRVAGSVTVLAVSLASGLLVAVAGRRLGVRWAPS